RLSKQCDPLHKPAVDLALTTMTGIASDINNMKRKHEHAVRVQEIQAQLYGWNGPDLTALGELIAEGTFRVVGARGRRHVFLFEKVLLLAKNKQGGALAYKSHIMYTNDQFFLTTVFFALRKYYICSIFCRQTGRKAVTNDPSSVWCEEKVKLPTKADSLPRSFQLYDQPDSTNGVECKNERLVLDMSLKENPDFDVEEQQENDLSSQLDDTEHPDHKIYRKSTIRFSILQRIRHIMSEEQKRIQKYPIRKQGSKSMGEKIAHPDYVDPQKLFLGMSSRKFL
uniref:Uncharacterized protein LOC114341104 n=1 Tax=Diabrotica virgifera virgifera TaxID=50390 RepID=A0A6P7GDW2_DIAVI